jgi:hypothetical protein
MRLMSVGFIVDTCTLYTTHFLDALSRGCELERIYVVHPPKHFLFKIHFPRCFYFDAAGELKGSRLVMVDMNDLLRESGGWK